MTFMMENWKIQRYLVHDIHTKFNGNTGSFTEFEEFDFLGYTSVKNSS
jgi:hypothetical protein